MISQETIEEVKQKLINLYNPVEIYLFGSYDWGCPDEESDLDLLIVVDTFKDRYKAMGEGHKALIGMKLSKDILLYNKEEFAKYSKDKTTFCYKIKKKGKKIYARA